jgi:hypothetical protein
MHRALTQAVDEAWESQSSSLYLYVFACEDEHAHIIPRQKSWYSMLPWE